MPRTLIAIAALLCSAASPPELEGFTKITGSSVRIMSENYADPPPGEKKDRLGIYIYEKAAKAIFDAIPGRSRPGPSPADYVVRSAGNLECLKYSNGEYFCSVGIILTNGKTAYAAED